MNAPSLIRSLANVAASFFLIAALLWVTPFLASRLGPWQFAMVAVLTSVASLLGIFESGLGSSCAVLSSRTVSGGVPEGLRSILTEGVRLARLRGALLALVGLVTLPLALSFFDAPGPGAGSYALAVMIAIVSVLSAPYVGVLSGLGRGPSLNSAVAFSSAIRIAAVAVLVREYESANAALCALVLSAVALLALSSRFLSDLPAGSSDLPDIRSELVQLVRGRFRQTVLPGLSSVLLGYFDIVLVFILFGAWATFFYALGHALFSAARLLVGVMDPIIIGLLYGKGRGDDEDGPDASALFRWSLISSSSVLLPVAAATILLSQSWLPWLAGSESLLVGQVSGLLILGVVPGMLSSYSQAKIRKANRQVTVGLLSAGEPLLAVSLAWFLSSGSSSVSGVIGVAAGFSITRLVFGLVVHPAIALHGTLPKLFWTLAHLAFTGLVTASLTLLACTWVLRFLPSGLPWILLAIVGGVFIHLSLAAFVVLGGKERRQLWNRVRGVGSY